jgi:hypothetical protein
MGTLIIFYLFANGGVVVLAYISYVVFYTKTLYHSFIKVK